MKILTSILLGVSLTDAHGHHYFPKHSWKKLDTSLLSVPDVFEQETLSELDEKALGKKLRDNLKEALKFEAMDTEVGTIKATNKARSMINIEKVLTKKLNEKLQKGGNLDDLKDQMKFVE